MKSVAVIIPCLNEENTVGKVIRDFREQLPSADIYVIDNNSTDATAARAEEAGATVIPESRPGKGCAIRKAFRSVEADVYVMVDGDDTLPADRVNALLAPVLDDRADVVVGSRLADRSGSGFRFRNRIGNMFFRCLINRLFRAELTDVLSGYRALSRSCVKRIQILARGFEIETEMTITAINRGFRIQEIPVTLTPREHSVSKLCIIGDGLRITGRIISLFSSYRPLAFFGSLGLSGIILLVLSLILGIPTPGTGYLVPLVHWGLALAALLSFTAGGILHVATRRFQELDHRLDLLNDEISRPG